MLRKLYFIPALFIALLMHSCSNNEGCTDPVAINYDENAEEDDGSCEYDEGDPQEISGTINTPTTFSNIFSSKHVYDYIVTGNVTIDAAVTIDPGVRILMKSGAQITVRSEGSLDISGTPEDSIIIRGEQNIPGFWNFIRFNASNNPNNKIIYAGIYNGGGDSRRDAVVYLSRNSRLSIENTTIAVSERNGFVSSGSDAVIPSFKNNLIKSCNLYPVELNNFYQSVNFDASSSFDESNGVNFVRVGNTTIPNAFTIPKINGYYEKHGNTSLDGDVEIEAGTNIKMGAGSRITVRSSGSLKCSGSPSERITIEGSQEVEGFFECIRYNGSNNPNNEFQYVDVNYGGGDSRYDAAIYLSSNSRFKMGNSSINYSARYGLSGGNSAIFDDDGNNTFTGNLLGDIDL
ncbi:MAG: hypothetical protein LAT54_02965 [Cryomorphaceae bacterium]|nr:hypothetical protein [Cryomorphaceae bacterium]